MRIAKYLLLLVFVSSQTFADTGMSFERFERLNEPLNRSEVDYWVNIRHSKDYEYTWADGHLDLDLRFYSQKNDFLYSFSEFYLTNKNSVEEYSVGRKRLRWNTAERFWLLEDINSNQSFSLLGEKQDGLFGFHHTRKYKKFTLNIFASYMYIPQLNPVVDSEDGKVSSKAEWVKLPPTKTVVFDEVVPISYQINMPEVYKIALQRALGVRVKYDDKIKDLAYSQAFYLMYKPENRVRVNATAYYDVDKSKVIVEANPIVNHHMIYGTEFNTSFKEINTSTGLVMVDPTAAWGKDFLVPGPDQLRGNLKEFSSDDPDFFKVKPNYDKRTYAYTNWNVGNEKFGGSFNYFYLFNGAAEGDDFYSETSKWVNAVGLAGFVKMGRFFTLESKWRYDFDRNDNLLSASLTYGHRQFWTSLGVEMISSRRKESYWSAYRANDIAFINVGYIF